VADLARLESRLGYSFGDRQLLTRALTHRSAGKRNNERLEFLGDSVVNHIIAEALYHRFPRAHEGEMSRMRAALVSGDALADIALELDVGDYLVLDQGVRKSGGHRLGSILADALEAIAGAILLDSGLEECRRCVLGWYGKRLDETSPDATAKDPKTRLQEYLQGRGHERPHYQLLDVSGEGHRQQFRVCCEIRDLELAFEGAGRSRRKAEQVAAGAALARLERHG
jgi:ribonuclease-3